MDAATQIHLVERVLALLEAGKTETAARGAEVPTSRYHDPAELEREQRALFRGLPLIVGHASRLARPGDFVTHDASGAPILAVQPPGDAPPRAFLNVCRHRGTRVEPAASGAAKRAFVCPYHGWTYDLGGRLEHIPHEAGFCDFDRGALGLVPLPCERAGGFLWVTPTPGPARPVADHLGPAITADLDAMRLADHVVHAPMRARKRLNWKLAIEIFLEAYHVKRAHARSIYPMFFDNVALYDAFGLHLRNYFPRRSITDLRGEDRAAWSARAHGNALYVLFPNTLVLVQKEHAHVFHVFPRGPEETEIEGYMLIPEPPATEKAQRHWDKHDAVLLSAVEEDFAMGESIQQGLRSGANDVMRYGRFEHSLTWFHERVQAVIAAGPEAAGRSFLPAARSR